MMLLRPKKLPDETIFSLLARIARLNGMAHLDAVGFLMGEQHPVSVIGCPANINYFCDITEGVYGSPKEILHTMTVLPMRAHLGELDLSMLSQVGEGRMRPPLAALDFGIVNRCKWKICRECMAQDVKEYGIAYWHRAHQLPTAQYCPEHALQLTILNVHRKTLYDQLVLPDCFANELNISDSQIRQEIGSINLGVSILGREGLSDFTEPLPQIAIQATFKTRLMEVGLLTSTGKLCHEAYVSHFMQEFGSVDSMAVMLHQIRIRHPRQLLSGINDNNSGTPFSKLVLAQSLFGSWQAFKQECLWHDVLNDSHETKELTAALKMQQIVGHRAEERLVQHRNACLAYMASHENPTRMGFMRVAQRSSRWLLHNDHQWLDEQLPVLPRGRPQGDLFD